MKSSSRLFVLLAMGSALAATASLSDGASASSHSAVTMPNEPTRTVSPPAGPGWNVYTDSVPLSATVSIVEGKKNADGSCTFSASGSVPPGGLAVHSDEIAFNATTCESQVSEYQLSNDEAVAADAAGESEGGKATGLTVTESTPSASGAAKGSGVSPLAIGSDGAYSRTWYEDPPGFDVTSVRNSTNWSYNGTCVLSNTARAQYSWIDATGWDLLSDDLNGGFTWSYDVAKSGGCTGLLSLHHSAAYN